MNIRIGRLRIVDLLLFASGALQLHLLFNPSVRIVEGGEISFHTVSVWHNGTPLVWPVLISGSLAILVLPFSLLRRSPASSLSTAVFLVPVGLLNVFAILALAFFVPSHFEWSDDQYYQWPFFLMMFNAVLLVALDFLVLREESRGIKPDPSPEATTLSLNDAQPNSQSE